MANGWSLIIGLIIIVALSTAAWFLSPKGDNQTLFRSTLILAFVSCYLMWGMYYLSFVHASIISPKEIANNFTSYSHRLPLTVTPPYCTKALRHPTRSCTAIEACSCCDFSSFLHFCHWTF
ncbi:uncharacterized protein N7529_000291 [Penicillium soppii]|uniref:uncharacterized protein n=1 Tax=Penicillium soppii TaxID=69789 RepID=UPI00254700B2|nr:uncharacterized protein N7529_000291 [Penicillium soppii]KAJ5881619.1 hypothetical protein N7529_000291 [Penicillium soppii]